MKPVGVEVGQLLLDPAKRVGELAVVERLDGVFDPLQEIRGEAFVLLDHLVTLHSDADHLWSTLRNILSGSSLTFRHKIS